MPKPRPDWSASEYKWMQFHNSKKKMWQIGHNWCCINILGRVFSYRVRAAHVTRELQDGDVIFGMQVFICWDAHLSTHHCLWFFSRCRCLYFKMLIFSSDPRIFFYDSFQGTLQEIVFFKVLHLPGHSTGSIALHCSSRQSHSFIRYELILVINTLKIGIALTKWLPDWY